MSESLHNAPIDIFDHENVVTLPLNAANSENAAACPFIGIVPLHFIASRKIAGKFLLEIHCYSLVQLMLLPRKALEQAGALAPA